MLKLLWRKTRKKKAKLWLTTISLSVFFSSFAQDLALPAGNVESELSEATYHLNVGTRLRKEWNVDSALWHLYQALDLFEKEGNVSMIAASSRQVGTSLCMNGNYENGREFLTKSISLYEEIKDTVAWARVMNNLGTSYFKERNYNLVLKYCRESFRLSYECSTSKDYGSCVMNIAAAHNQIDQLDSASYYFNLASENYLENENFEPLAMNYTNHGVMFFRQDQHDSALHYVSLGLDAANRANSPAAKLTALNNLMQIYEDLEQFEQAFAIVEPYYSLKDSISGVEQALRIDELEIIHETKENQAELAKLASTNKAQTLLSLLIGAVLVAIIISLFWVYRSRRKRLVEIADAIYRGRKTEHKRVADHLIDDVAQTIEEAAEVLESEPAKARGYLHLANTRIFRLANLNYSQAMNEEGIRGALEKLCESIHEDSGITVETKMNLLDLPTREEEEDIFELCEKLLVHVVKFNAPKKIDLEVETKDGQSTITVSRYTDTPHESSTMYENLVLTLEHLGGTVRNIVREGGPTQTILQF